MYEIQEVGDRHIKLQVKGIMGLYQHSVSVQRCSKRYLLVKTKYHKMSWAKCLLLYYIISIWKQNKLSILQMFRFIHGPGVGSDIRDMFRSNLSTPFKLVLILISNQLHWYRINYTQRQQYWYFRASAVLVHSIVDSIGRGSSHNIEVGPHAHDSKNNSLHHCQGKFWCKMKGSHSRKFFRP